MSIDSNRKDEHVDLAVEQYKAESQSDFQKIRFVHHSLSQIKTADVSLETNLLGYKTDVPFYINGMTGGSEKTKHINGQLAEVAAACGLIMASGSVSAALKDPSLTDSFTIIREKNPNGIVLANLGAHHSLENAKRAVDILGANGLQIHLNTAQELVMPEGDRDFSMWLAQIEDIVANLDVPVMVKEVGFGMSRETIMQLKNVGVQWIDVSGRGGTNFAAIENARRTTFSYDDLENWGQSTVLSLIEANEVADDVHLLASGGIKTPFDIVKALSLGAEAVGLSGQFLQMVLDLGPEKTIETVNDWKEKIISILTLLGKKSVSELHETDLIFHRDIMDWCEMRSIDYRQFGQRLKYRVRGK